jgi:hypothetical protein
MLASAQDGAKKDDRIKAARQMYAKLPPIVLGLTEPVKFTYAQVAKDGGSVHIRLEDAKQNARNLWLDRNLKTKTYDAISFSTPKKYSLSLVGGSAEEAALYGMLLRWTDKKTPGVDAGAMQSVLHVLERRVVGDAPVRTEITDKDGKDGKK